MNTRRAPLAAILVGLLLTLGACDNHPTSSGNDCCQCIYDRITITQGIWGEVRFWSGNFQPTSPSGRICPVVREVHIYQLTTMDDVVMPKPAFYSEIQMEKVAEVTSDECGLYEVTLSPGAYSVFVWEDTLYYANSFDGQGNIQAVFVDNGRVSERRVDITYAATF